MKEIRELQEEFDKTPFNEETAERVAYLVKCLFTNYKELKDNE